jgi:hypothetical protein
MYTKRTFNTEIEGADAFANIWLKKAGSNETLGRLSKGAAMRLSKTWDKAVIEKAMAHNADSSKEGNYRFVAIVEVVIPSDVPADADIADLEEA